MVITGGNTIVLVYHFAIQWLTRVLNTTLKLLAYHTFLTKKVTPVVWQLGGTFGELWKDLVCLMRLCQYEVNTFSIKNPDFLRKSSPLSLKSRSIFFSFFAPKGSFCHTKWCIDGPLPLVICMTDRDRRWVITHRSIYHYSDISCFSSLPITTLL